MNKHEQEAAAIKKRVDAGKEYQRKRVQRLKDAYQCYLAYIGIR